MPGVGNAVIRQERSKTTLTGTDMMDAALT